MGKLFITKPGVAGVGEQLKVRWHRDSSEDPLGLAGGMNLYRFAVNGFSWVDPLGLAKTKCSLIDKIIDDANKVASSGGEITPDLVGSIRWDWLSVKILQAKKNYQNILKIMARDFRQHQKLSI